MKRIAITLCTALVAFLVLSAFISRTVATSIHGTVTPADGAKKVWAISGTDSVSTVPAGGNFSLDVKAGTYKLVVEANAPYKDATVESVVVEDGKSADAGEIKLSQ
jgi:hypothetical protein